jgi:WD40 repeat protein
VQRRQDITGAQIDSVSFSRNDRLFAVTSVDGSGAGEVQVYDLATEKLYKTVMTFDSLWEIAQKPAGAFFSKDGRQLIVQTPTESDKAIIFDSATLEVTTQKSHAYISTQHASWGKGYSAEITNIHSQYVIVVHMGGHPFLIKVPEECYQFAIDTLHNELAIASFTGGIYIYDLHKRKITGHFSCREEPSTLNKILYVTPSIAWFPEHRLIWASNVEGRSVFWDPLHHKVKADIQLPLVMTSAAINHAGDSIAFGTMDGQVYIIRTKQLMKAINDGSIVKFLTYPNLTKPINNSRW